MTSSIFATTSRRSSRVAPRRQAADLGAKRLDAARLALALGSVALAFG